MNISEIKLNIFSEIHRTINRAFNLEDTMEGLLGALSEALPLSTAAIVLGGAEDRFFIAPSFESNGDTEHRIRGLYKKAFDLFFRSPRPFVVLRDNPMPLFLDRKALHSIQKAEVCLAGAPVVLNGEAVGAIMADRLFGSQVPLVEDVQFLSMLAGFIGQVLSLELQAKRREEALTRENLSLKTRISEEHLGLVCLGTSRAAANLEDEIRKAARTDAPILLWGEPGTWRSSIARIIHQLSPRAAFPFVKTHCSLPENLLEKELFGNGNGQSCGDLDEATLFGKAAGGTLLLDEVGELSIPHQIRLLDILDESQAGRFAVTWAKGLNARLVSATSVNLSEAAGTVPFRKDLLGRLSTLLIHVPPIRERKEDIGPLIMHFLAEACAEQGRKVVLGAQALKRLCEYDWPGNMAEIRKTMARLVIMADGEEVRARDIDSVFVPVRLENPGTPDSNGTNALSRLDEIERKEVSAALERNRWIRRKAAVDLGLTSRQMNYRVKKFGLDGLIQRNRTRARSG